MGWKCVAVCSTIIKDFQFSCDSPQSSASLAHLFSLVLKLQRYTNSLPGCFYASSASVISRTGSSFFDLACLWPACLATALVNYSVFCSNCSLPGFHLPDSPFLGSTFLFGSQSKDYCSVEPELWTLFSLDFFHCLLWNSLMYIQEHEHYSNKVFCWLHLCYSTTPLLQYNTVDYQLTLLFHKATLSGSRGSSSVAQSRICPLLNLSLRIHRGIRLSVWTGLFYKCCAHDRRQKRQSGATDLSEMWSCAYRPEHVQCSEVFTINACFHHSLPTWLTFWGLT